MGSKTIPPKGEPQEIVLTAEAIQSNFLPKYDFPQTIGSPPTIRKPNE